MAKRMVRKNGFVGILARQVLWQYVSSAHSFPLCPHVFCLFVPPFTLFVTQGANFAEISAHEFLLCTCLFLQLQPSESATNIVEGFTSSIMVQVHRQDKKKASKPAAVADSDDEFEDEDLAESLAADAGDAADAAPSSEHDVERRDAGGRTNVFSKPSNVSKVSCVCDLIFYFKFHS
jgi:hypothetical protein